MRFQYSWMIVCQSQCCSLRTSQQISWATGSPYRALQCVVSSHWFRALHGWPIRWNWRRYCWGWLKLRFWVHHSLPRVWWCDDVLSRVPHWDSTHIFLTLPVLHWNYAVFHPKWLNVAPLATFSAVQLPSNGLVEYFSSVTTILESSLEAAFAPPLIGFELCQSALKVRD